MEPCCRNDAGCLLPPMRVLAVLLFMETALLFLAGKLRLMAAVRACLAGELSHGCAGSRVTLWYSDLSSSIRYHPTPRAVCLYACSFNGYGDMPICMLLSAIRVCLAAYLMCTHVHMPALICQRACYGACGTDLGYVTRVLSYTMAPSYGTMLHYDTTQPNQAQKNKKKTVNKLQN